MIFLIKIKHFITYSAIGVLFNVNRTTVPRIFFSILEVLVGKTKISFFGQIKSQL